MTDGNLDIRVKVVEDFLGSWTKMVDDRLRELEGTAENVVLGQNFYNKRLADLERQVAEWVAMQMSSLIESAEALPRKRGRPPGQKREPTEGQKAYYERLKAGAMKKILAEKALEGSEG